MISHYKHSDLTGGISKCFHTVYDELGFGHLEKVYCNGLQFEFEAFALPFARECALEVFYKRRNAGHYRADFLVGRAVVVEVKATRVIAEEDRRQLLNALKASRVEVGLLLHFGPRPRIHRLIYDNSRKHGIPEFTTV